MTSKMILVPLDGSVLAEGVLPYAATLARFTDSELRLLCVVAPVGTDGWSAAVAAEEHRTQERVEQAARYLEAVTLRLQDQGLAPKTSVVTGDVVEGILDAGSAADVGLIAMATHGRGGAKRLVLGSVADRVMRLAAAPTLLVRPGEGEDPARAISLRRILVPLDGSPLAEQALPLAEQLARAAGATLVLARVEPHLWQTGVGLLVTSDLAVLDEQATSQLATYLKRVQAALSPGIASEVTSLRGEPAAVLEALALSGTIDLIVMATHGRGGLRRLVLGSMADRLVRLGAPALLVRPATPVTPDGADAMETPLRSTSAS